MIDNQLLAI